LRDFPRQLTNENWHAEISPFSQNNGGVPVIYPCVYQVFEVFKEKSGGRGGWEEEWSMEKG
jgi:hypothetical protein